MAIKNATTQAGAAQPRGRTPVGGETAELPRIWDLFSDDTLIPRLLLLAKMIERQASRQLQRHFQMSVAQWRVLAFVSISGPSTAAFIADSAEVDQAEISRAVKALLERGFISREFEPGSRKRLTIAASPAGLQQFAKVRNMRQAYFGRITEAVSTAEAHQVTRSLRSLADRVVQERKSTAPE